MPTEGELLAVIRTAFQGEARRLDPQAGRTWQTSLQRLLGVPVEDWTDYTRDRSYRFSHRLTSETDPAWQALLRIRISSLGPYATQTFLLQPNQDQWWKGPIRADRVGFRPEHANSLQRLRAWYEEQGLQELPPESQAALLPADLTVRLRPGRDYTIFYALFGP